MEWFPFVQGRPSPVIAYSVDTSYYDQNPNWGVFIQAIETSLPMPITFVEPQLKTMENSFLRRAFSGNEPPRQVLDEYQRTAQLMLDEYLATRRQ